MGLNARSAMAPGGAAEGFGDLAAALMMAPQLRRKLDQEDMDRMEAQKARQRDLDYRDRQLQQALQFHNDDMGLQRDRLDEERGYHQSEGARKFLTDVGSGIDNAWKRGNETLKIALSGKDPSAGRFDPYLTTETDDGLGGHRRERVLKTPEQAIQERELQGIFRNPQGWKPSAPAVAPPPARQPQRPAFDAGKVPPAPSFMNQLIGSGSSAPVAPLPSKAEAVAPVEPGAPDPAVATQAMKPKGLVRHAALADMVASGQYPTIEAAAEHAKSLGYVVAP